MEDMKKMCVEKRVNIKHNSNLLWMKGGWIILIINWIKSLKK